MSMTNRLVRGVRIFFTVQLIFISSGAVVWGQSTLDRGRFLQCIDQSQKARWAHCAATTDSMMDGPPICTSNAAPRYINQCYRKAGGRSRTSCAAKCALSAVGSAERCNRGEDMDQCWDGHWYHQKLSTCVAHCSSAPSPASTPLVNPVTVRKRAVAMEQRFRRRESDWSRNVAKALLHFENYVLWNSVNQNVWRKRQASWKRSVGSSKSVPEMASAMVSFEQSIGWSAMGDEWRKNRDGWIAFTKGVTTSRGLAASLLELEGAIRWEAMNAEWRSARANWAQPVRVIAGAGNTLPTINTRSYRGAIVLTSGAAPVRAGASCTVTLNQSTGGLGGGGWHNCRVVVQCGGVALYGSTPRTGYNQCRVEGQNVTVHDHRHDDSDPVLILEAPRGPAIVRVARWTIVVHLTGR